MLTKKSIKREAQKHGAIVLDTFFDSYSHSYGFDVEAPDGYQWQATDSYALPVAWDCPEMKQEEFERLLTDMSRGLKKVSE